MPDNTKHSDLNRERKRAGLLLAALEYAAKGLSVFPCLNKLGDPGNKRPLTKQGFKDASCDPKVVSGWWDRWPTALIGMPTGEHFCVLDLDCKKGKNGLAVVSDWSERSPLIAITGSDGRHLYFLPDDEIGCITDEIALGVDTRGKGGYVIVPPSEGYSWVNGHGLSDLSKLPPWPDDLRPSGAARERKEGQCKTKEDLVATDPDQLAFAVGVIPNNSSNYLKWKKMGMAIFAAMADRDRGFQVFDEFSKRWTCGEYEAVGVKKAWEQIEGSPPADIGAGSIYRWADQAAPGWNDGYQELKRARIEGSEEERAKANARESELLDALAKTKGLDYDRQRKKAAKELGVSFRALDEEVKARREDAVAAPLYGHWIVEPWPEPVDGDALLRDIINRIHRHVVLVETAL
jgi:hypothetical protein